MIQQVSYRQGNREASRLHEPLYQSGLVKIWNSLARFKRGENNIPVSLESLLVKVNRQARNDAWKTGPQLDALAVLLGAINETGRLHAFGRFYVKTMLAELLINRARLHELWQAVPGILAEQRVEKPIIILGLPRSGTSFLFNLLAQDPSHRCLSNWETTVSQVPPERPCAYLRDPRRRKGRYLMWFQNYLAPHLQEIHEFHLDGPEECTPLLMQGFATQALAGMFNVPSYSNWLNGVAHEDTYRHHKRILQTLQWRYPGTRWVLKSPDHLAAIDAIIQVYPDACLVHLHRDPLQSVASWASLNAAFRSITAQSVDSGELGAQVLDRLATDMDSYLRQRRGCGNDRFLDVRYDDLVRDPIRVVEGLYQRFDLDFSPDARKAMRGFLDQDRAKSRHHRYTPEDFGLSEEMIDSRFGKYMDTFDVPRLR